MNIGRLHNRALLYHRTTEPNEYSEPVVTWTHYGYMWLSLEEQSANEDTQADRPVMVTTAIAKTRYRTDIVPTDRFVTGGATWEIKSIVNDNMNNEMLVMQCTKTD